MSRLSAATSSSSTKFKIEQRVPSGSVKKGPYAVERSVNPNELVIKRRFGEGSKPLFQRDDITINHGESIDSDIRVNFSKNAYDYHENYHTSAESNSPERFRVHDTHSTAHANPRHHTVSKRTAKPDESVSPYRQTTKQRTPESIPYYADEVREKDRLRRLYGTSAPKSRRSRSRSEPRTDLASSSRHRATAHSARHRRSYSRERYGERDSRRARERRRSRSHSRGRYYKDTSHRKCDHRNCDHHRSRSTSRDRRHKKYDEPTVPAPQIITIPIPVAEYPYPYSAWPPQSTWGPPAPLPHAFPPPAGTRYPSYQIPPLMPMMRPAYGVPPFNMRTFRPQQRYPTHSTLRPTRGNFRPRNA